MNKDIVIEKMRNRGYSRVLENRNNFDETVSITFIYNPTEYDKTKRFPVPMYNVTVWLEDLEFQFMYAIPSSINKLISPKCGSFMNDEHFDKLAMKFERDSAILDKYCNI